MYKVKLFLGIFLFICAILSGLYVGFYICLYGGIIQIIEGLKNNYEAATIAKGIIKVLVAGPGGWGVFAFIMFIAKAVGPSEGDHFIHAWDKATADRNRRR